MLSDDTPQPQPPAATTEQPPATDTPSVSRTPTPGFRAALRRNWKGIYTGCITGGFAVGFTAPITWRWFLDQDLDPAQGTIIGGFFIVTAAAVAYTGSHLARVSTERIATDKNTLDATTAQRTHDLADTQELRRRFVTTTAQFADPSPEIRLAGVYALEALVDDWIDRGKHTDAQTCINYLCGYLTRPYTPPTDDPHLRQTVVTPDIGTHVQRTYHHPYDDLNVRQAITRTIAAHLRPDNHHNWSSYNYDLTGAHFHNADFSGAHFRGTTDFTKAQFCGERTSFDLAQFRSEQTSFDLAQFHGKQTSFDGAQFRSGRTWFIGVQFRSEQTSFHWAQFHGERTSFGLAQFHGKRTSFDGAQFRSARRTWFMGAQFHSEQTSFIGVQFHGAQTSFHGAQFRSEQTSFDRAQFHGAQTRFGEAQFHGERTSFIGVQFHSERTTFDSPAAWNNVYFDWDPEDPDAAKGAQPDSVSPHDWPPTVVAPEP